jgi:hypothetical protein
MENINERIHKRTNRYIDSNLALELNAKIDVKLHIELDELYYQYMTVKLYRQLWVEIKNQLKNEEYK